MAKTNAEHQRLWRQRRKEKKEAALKTADAVDIGSILKTPFSQWAETDDLWEDFMIMVENAGIEPPDFAPDVDHKLNIHDQNIEPGSIAHADVMAGYLYHALVSLTGTIRRFKISEIEARIAEIEASDLTDPEIKRKALADIVRLKGMLDHLNKEVRLSLRQWKLADDPSA